ncbi:MAG: head decoration protein, partial [Pyrinomonadaceae bacterium]
MSGFGGFAIPGQGSASMTTEREIIAQGFDSRQCVFKSIVVDGASRDAGNTPTTVLRPGLLLAKETSSGQYSEWDADASDGSQYLGAVLWKELRAQDFDATNIDRHFTAIVGKAVLQASRLLIQGTAFTSHADQYLARRQLFAGGFVLDDDPFSYLAGQGDRFETVTGTSDTITADQNGMTLFYSSVSAVAITLPTLAPGLEFRFVRTADEEMVVASAGSNDDIICGGDAGADSVTWTTASQHIGAQVRFRSAYVATTLKWLAEV